MNTLQGKIVLITGAGKGSGRLLARVFAERGAIVALNDISPVNVEEAVEHILAQGGRAKSYVDDVAKKVAVQHIINQVEDDFGPIDILVHHAAVEPHIPLLDMDEWDWHRTLDVNLTGAFLMTQSVGRVMRLRGAGVIIHLITRSGYEGSPDLKAPQDKSAFIASMDGLEAFSRQAARELHPYGIKVHALETDRKNIVEAVFALLDAQSEER